MAVKNFKCLLTILLVIILSASCLRGSSGLELEEPFCPDEAEYSPCTCSLSPEGKFIGCFNVLAEDVRGVFGNPNTSSIDLYHRVRINLNVSDETIPEDLLNSRTASHLEIHCPDRNPYRLQVDPKAFSPSYDVLTTLEIANCDLTKTDFSFLSGFFRLDKLTFTSCSNLHVMFPSTLPSLGSLTDLAIHRSYDLRELTTFPTLSKGLKAFRLYGNAETSALNDPAVGRILDWVLESSAGSLETLQLNYNVLTEVPAQISRFKALHSLYIQNNFISLVPSCSVLFTAPVRSFAFHSSKLQHLKPNAFQGDFSRAKAISFIDNGLTRLEASAFRPLLEQLRETDAVVYVEQNPIDCTGDPCHLSWLVYDDWDLLRKVPTARCSNGTLLSELRYEDFENCPEIERTDVTCELPDTSGGSQNIRWRLDHLVCLVLTFLFLSGTFHE